MISITTSVKLAWDKETATSCEKGVEVEGDADGADLPTNSVTMFNRGLNFPIVQRVTLCHTGDFNDDSSYDKTFLQYGLEAGSTTDPATWTINAPPGEEKKVRVNVKQDISGIIALSSVQMVEENQRGS
jgi:hypothetical protein